MNNKVKFKGPMKHFMRWPLYLSVLVVLLDLLVFIVSVKAGILVSVGTVIYIFIAVQLFRYHKPLIINDMIAFANQYDVVEKRMLEELALPYAIMDMEGRMIWSNRIFSEITGRDQFYKKNISTVFPDITPDKLPVADEPEISEMSIHFGDRIYRVSMQRVTMGEVVSHADILENMSQNVSLIAMYLYDETELKEYIQKNEDNKLVVALAYLDNYEEALESVEDVRRSLLIALIDRKITKYFSNFDGLVKKLEKDKYLLIMRQSSLETLKEQRFHILDEVKTVNIGNEMAVTLSIGIGLNASTYIQNYEYARTSIDMALGRGGDQAVVKDSDKIQYYGGKAQQMEKTTRVKARVKAHALRELMENKDRLLIMGHRLADIDSFGAAVGIYRIAMSMNKKANIVVNEVTSSVRPMMERFTGNAEYPEDMLLTGPKAAELVDQGTMLVIVDVNRPSITDEPALLEMVKTVVVLDHHRTSSEIIDNAVLSYVEPYASSTCEMVAEVLQYIADGIKIKSAEADAMYAGIVIDTQNFTNQTGVRTFEAAAFLRRSGADITRVRKLFRENMKDYQAKADAVRKAEVFMDAFAISECSAEGLESPTIIGAQAANELLEIRGMKASVVLTDYNGTIYFSARSIDEVNVQVMMEKLGGGGHRTIAGAQMQGVTVEEAKERLKDVIRQMMEEGEVS